MKRIGVTFGSPKMEARAGDFFRDLAEVSWLPGGTADRGKSMESCDIVLTQFLSEGEFSDSEWESLKKVPAVHTVSAGVDQVPFGRIGHRTDVYANVGGWAPPIAEHVLAMALCCSRRLVQQSRDLASGTFRYLGYGLKTLRGKVALIVGYGGIGRETGRLLSDFGMEIHGLGRRAPEDRVLGRSWPMDRLEEALGQADLVLLSLPLSSVTEGLFDDKVFESMKKDAIFINIARAGIVDEGSLYRKLRSCPDFFAALDVWWNEPRDGGVFSTSEPLFELPNLVGSAHNSNQNEFAMDHALNEAMANCARILRGEPAMGLVKKDEYI